MERMNSKRNDSFVEWKMLWMKQEKKNTKTKTIFFFTCVC